MDKERRFTDEEIGIMKSVFAENKTLLKIVRKFFLQLPMSDIESTLLSQVKKPEVVKVLEKSFLPTIDGDAPFHQVIDLWMTIKLDGMTPDVAINYLKSRDVLIKYFGEMLKVIKGEDANIISLDSLLYSADKDEDENFVDLLSRNSIVGHVEMQINQIFVLAGKKDEDVETTLRELDKKNSAK
jgi:hypothetical protein